MLEFAAQLGHNKAAGGCASNTTRLPDQSRRWRAIMANLDITPVAGDSQYSKTEVWKPIPSEPGSMASSWGRILRAPNFAPMPLGGYRAYIPEPGFGQVTKAKSTASHEYMLVMMKRPESGLRKKPRKVHQLVCEAFHGPKPFPSAVVIHEDENGHNNRPENLRWGTQKENMNMPNVKAYHRSRTGENSSGAKGAARRAA